MTSFFRDTPFGWTFRTLSGGRLFAWDEFKDQELVQRYLRSAEPADAAAIQGNEKKEEKSDDSDSVKDDNQSTNSDAESGVDVQLISWLENDPEKPENWSKAKKFFVTFEICLLTTSVYIGSAIYTSGITGIEQYFQVSQVKALVGLTLFVLGYALGPMIWAPLSEVPFFGRNPIYISTLAAFIVLNVPVALAPNYSTLMAFRFLTGFVGSPVLATGGATISDMYKPSKRAYGIGIWGVAAVCGPVLGPLVGGFAAAAESWRWPIWELMWLCGFCLVFLYFFLPETSASNILYRRTVRLRQATGNQKLKSQGEIEAEGMSAAEGIQMALVRPFTLALTEPICLALNMMIALIYGLLYLWFESFPIVFIGTYGFTAGTLGLAYLGIFVGALAVIPPFFWYLYHYTEPQFNDKGELKPELRLPPAFVGIICIPICLFWFGATSRESIHWIVPIIGTSLFSIGAFLLFNSALNYLGDAYPKYVSSVYAGNDLMRSAFGAAFPLFGGAMFRNLGTMWASFLLGFLGIAFIPIPFVLYKYGEQIRKRSKYARHDL